MESDRSGFFLVAVDMIPILLSSIISLVSSQSNYICGVEGYSFHSDVPCNYYPVCANGGFKLFVGCQNDVTCSLYSPSAVCVQQCCCTRPTIVGTTTDPNPIVRDHSFTPTLLPSILLLVTVILLRGGRFTLRDWKMAGRSMETILVTGATGGIGRAIASRLVRDGKSVYVTGRSEQKLNELSEELRSLRANGDQKIASFRFDIGRLSDVRRVMPEICEVSFDTVIFNAGIMFPYPPRPANEDDLPWMEDTLKTNVVGHFLMARHLLEKQQHPIRFVCLSSNTAKIAFASKRWETTPDGFHNFFARTKYFTDGWASYIDSKLAVIVMAQWLNKNAGDHVSAVAIHPGVAKTAMVDSIPDWQRLILRPLTRFQTFEGADICADRVITNAALSEDDFTNKWFCQGVVDIPRVTQIQRDAFMGFLHNVTDGYM